MCGKHSSTVSPGTSKERVRCSLVHIGPAVANGAMTTLLAVAILSTSTTAVFRNMFKVNPMT